MELKNLPRNPVAVTMTMIGCRWKILIITELLKSPKRFNEIKKSLKPITQKVLTTKLRELEQDGILYRETLDSKVEYTLTDIGYSLHPVMISLQDWGKDYKKYAKLIENKKQSTN